MNSHLGNLPDLGIEPLVSFLAGRFFIIESPGKLKLSNKIYIYIFIVSFNGHHFRHFTQTRSFNFLVHPKRKVLLLSAFYR